VVAGKEGLGTTFTVTLPVAPAPALSTSLA
jgi:hypothetical protein